MRPRLQSRLILDHRRKAGTPARAGIMLNRILHGIVMNQMRVRPSIIYLVSVEYTIKGGLHTENRRKLQYLSHTSKTPRLAQILVSNNGLCYALRLRF